MPDSAAQDDEQDFSIPGSDEADQGGIAGAPQNGAPDPQAAPPQGQATQPPPQAQPPAPQPQVSGRTAFLGNLLKAVMSGIQNAPGNPNNAFDRGYMANSPNAQAQQKANQQLTQAKVQTAQSEADQAKIQTSITGMKALQYEYLLKRLPQEDQEKHLDVVSKFKENLIKEGASIEAEGDDEKASDAQAMHLNGTDARSTGHAGKFYSLPTMDSSGKAKFDVVYVPTKDVLQNDFKYEDSEGEEQTIPAGTPMGGAMGKFVENQQRDAQNQTKAQHAQLGKLLTGIVPDGDVNQAIGTLQDMLKQNTPLAQQNKQAITDRIASLKLAHQQDQTDKTNVARAGRADAAASKNLGKDVLVHTDQGDRQMSAKEAEDQGFDDYSTLTSQAAQKNKDARANADASMTALKSYQQNLEGSADKLTSKDRDNLRILTSHVHADAGNGVLGGIIEDLPLAGPISGMANKILEGTITSQAYKDLSPAGKQLMADYSMAIVANFANMKQMLGTVGRNPQMIQAEMGQIPSPFLDKESAHDAFKKKISDISARNQSIPKMGYKGSAAPTSEGGGTHDFTFNGKQYKNVPDEVYKKYKDKPGFKD